MSSVTERRLRLVYDLLDCGNSKKALQEADRLLKKQPSFICAKALRALALLRLDRRDECRTIVDAVVAELPTDENSLQVVTICYKELHQSEKICDLYEAVNKKDPGNEEFLSHLFMAYVRVRNYKKQQQTAMALYKAWPKNPYYFWAVMSVLMQAAEGGASAQSKLSLQLAERLLEKFVRQNKVEAEAEVQLYLMVLEQQENYEAALGVLNGRLANLLRTPNLVRNKRATYLERLGKWRELVLFTQELIRHDPAQWSYYQTHLRAVFTLEDQRISAPAAGDVTTDGDFTHGRVPTVPVAENHVTNNVDGECGVSENHVSNHTENHTDDAKVEHTEQSESSSNETNEVSSNTKDPSRDVKSGSSDSEVSATTCAVSEDTSASPAATEQFLARLRQTVDSRERAPALAQISLALERQRRHLPHPPGFDAVDAVVAYISSYGDRACCFSDVEPVLELVQLEKVPDMLERCRTLVQLEPEVDARRHSVSTSQLQRHLTWLQLRHRYTSCEQLQQLLPTRLERAAELCRHHRGTAHLSQGLLDTELRPNDQYMLLAAYSLYEEWTTTSDVVHLLHALTMLQHGITLSPSNFLLKLAAIHIYHLLGAAGAAFAVYNTLDLKSIQLDTLSYVCSRHIAAQGHLASAQLVFNTVLRFFSNAKDTSDCLIAAYKVGSFAQIPEFAALRERLSNSTNYLLTLVDCVLLDLTTVASQHAQTVELLKYTSVQPVALAPIAWEKQRDNRDVTTMPAFSDIERSARQAAGALSWRHDLHLLRARQLTLRALVTALELPPRTTAAATAGAGDPPPGSDHPPSRGAALATLAEELSAASQPDDVTLTEQPQPARLSGPLPSRLPQLLSSGQLQLLSQLLSAAAAVADGGAPTEQAGQIESQCEELISRPPASVSGRPAAAMEQATLLTETVAVAAAVCGAVHSWCAPAKPAGKKGKKKKQAEDKMRGDSHLPHNRIVAALLKLTRAAGHLVASAGTELAAVSAASRLEQLQLADIDGADGSVDGADAAAPLRKAAVSVLHNLDESYRESVSELERVLQHKLEYLTACML